MVHRIQQLLESGLVEMWYNKYMPQSQALQCPHQLTGTDAVTVSDTLYVYLYVMAVGLTTALIILLLEIAVCRYFSESKVSFGKKDNAVAPLFKILMKNIPK